MNKNGFIFVETIVVITMLTTALLLLYSSFNNVLQEEKIRINYDDVPFIYRTNYIKNFLDKLNIEDIINDINNDKNQYFITLGIESDNLFIDHEKYKKSFNNILIDYNVNQLIITNIDKLEELKKYIKTCSMDKNCSELEKNNNIYIDLSEEMLNYIKTINVDDNSYNVLIVEYSLCDNQNCQQFYSWVSV